MGRGRWEEEGLVETRVQRAFGWGCCLVVPPTLCLTWPPGLQPPGGEVCLESPRVLAIVHLGVGEEKKKDMAQRTALRGMHRKEGRGRTGMGGWGQKLRTHR